MRTTRIEHSTGDYRGDGSITDRWLILDPTCNDTDGIAAGLWVDQDTREVLQIEVTPEFQGQGLARLLWETATADAVVLHAPVAHRTPEGNAFAVAVGGTTATYPCTCYGCTLEED